MKTRHLLALLAAGILIFSLVGCSDDEDCPTVPEEPAKAEFAGSATCAGCHGTQHAEWTDSGHPYKLAKLDGEAPISHFPEHSEYPNDPVDPPGDYTWDNTTYTVGGYGWKIRWIDENGYMVTSGAAGDLVQYNFETDAWVTYHSQDEPGTKPYNCGQCHNTGWVANEDPEDLTGNQDGLEGMHGTFLASGVHCEQCHGLGSLHVEDPDNVDMLVDRSSALCGECHTRDKYNRIAASGGYVKHHEQYDEWLHSPHFAGPGCNDCHNPHASVIFGGDPGVTGNGMTTSCTECHDATEYALRAEHPSFMDCKTCHMPKSSKSATVSAGNTYVADVHSHILAINTDPVGKTEGMFTEDGKFVRTENGQAKITLDFACYSCHEDVDGNGGSAPQLTLEELSAFANGIHPNAEEKRVSLR